MNEHYIDIYRNHAGRYDQLIAAEDVDNRLLPAILQNLVIDRKRILDIGTGTGRIPTLIHDRTGEIYGLDLHLGMLKEHSRKIHHHTDSWFLIQGDLRQLPFPGTFFDGVFAGWAIGHFQSWFSETWSREVDCALLEMMRVTKTGGFLMIIETLGTGSDSPGPPSKGLERYYNRLENIWGFTRQIISTDYLFDNLEEAVELSEFFFGRELSLKIRMNHWLRLPEWTGIWRKVLR